MSANANSVAMGNSMDRPLISFCLFAYNQERFIREAVESALAQTYTPLEIILSDDCSQDKTFEIMQAIACQYSGPNKVVLNRNETNLGPAKHINEIVKKTQGDWLVVMSGDDVSMPERTHAIMESVAGTPDAYAAFSGWHLIDENSCIIKKNQKCFDVEEVMTFGECQVEPCFKFLGAVAAWRRDLYFRFSPLLSDVVREDVVLAFRALLCGKIVVLPDALLLYRRYHRSVCKAEISNGTKYSEKVALTEEGNLAWHRATLSVYSQMKQDLDSNIVNRSMEGLYAEVSVSLFCRRWILQTKCDWWELEWYERARRVIEYLGLREKEKGFMKWMALRYWGKVCFLKSYGACLALKSHLQVVCRRDKGT